MMANDMDVASWKSIRPPTPQQRDARICGVYVIKVGYWLCTIITAYRATLGEYRPEVLGAAMSVQKKDRGLIEPDRQTTLI